MKKIFLSVLAMAACLVACTPEAEEIIESLELKGNAEVLLSVEGDMASISFTSTVDWTAASSADWLTITPTSGKAGDATVKASALRNESNDSRTANITITAGTKEAVVKVTQGQTDAISIGTVEYVVDCDGGEVEIEVSANVEYEVVIPAAVDWIHVAETKGMENSTVNLIVDATELYDTEHLDLENDADYIIRTANVTIKNGDISKVVTIGQKTFIPYFNYTGDWAGLQWSFYSGTPTAIPQEGADIEIDVDTNIDWKVYMSHNGVQEMESSWAHLSFDVETGKISLKVDANESYFARTDYIYAVGIVNGIEDGNFGGLGQITQEGLTPEGAVAELKWNFTLSELGIPAGYNRLAYKTLNGKALIVSDGDKIHALSPANGQYFKNITWTTVKPTSICSDDAGNVIVADDYVLSVDEVFKDFKVYYTADVNAEPVELFSHTPDFWGTMGSWRVRGNINDKAVVTSFTGSSRYWAGWEIVEGKVKLDANAYSHENGGQVRGPVKGNNDAWSPEAGAVMSRETTLAGGVIYRAYDILQSTWYLADAYTPNWQVPYNWTLLSDGGAGGNENQNNLSIVDYKGKIIMAYTQGYYFANSANATIYVFDITDMSNVKTIATITGDKYLVENQSWTGSTSADVLLHPGDDALELYVVHSGMNTLARIDILLED